MEEKIITDSTPILQPSETPKKKAKIIKFITNKNFFIILTAVVFSVGLIIYRGGYEFKLPYSWPTRNIVEAPEEQAPTRDPNINGFASPIYEVVSYNPGNEIKIYYTVAGSNTPYESLEMRQSDGSYYLSPTAYDSNTTQNYKINVDNFPSLVSFLIDEDSQNKTSQVFYITEYIEEGVNKISVLSSSQDGAFGRIYTNRVFEFVEFGKYASIDFMKSGDKTGNFVSLTTTPDQVINKQCDTFKESNYKGSEIQAKTICYHSNFYIGRVPYFIDNPEGVLSLLSLNKETFEVKSTTLPNELKERRLYANDITGYRADQADKPIIAISASLYEKDLEIKKVILDKAKFEVTVEPVDPNSKDDFPNTNQREGLNDGGLFTSETESKYFEIETNANKLLIKTKGADEDYDVKTTTEYELPLTSYKKVLTEYQKLKFVSPWNMHFETLDVPSGVGGGGGPDEEPFITIRVNKNEDLITFYLFGYVSATEEANYVSKTLVRQIDYKLSDNSLVNDSGYKYFDSLHTSAYSTNYIYQFNDDKNNFTFASGGGDGCGGGSSYSNLNLNTSQVNIKLDVLLIASSGCESVDNYREMYSDFNAKNFGDKITTYKNLIYFSSKERGLTDRNHYTQSWDNVTVLDLNTGNTKLIKQFASEPKYIDEVTYEYLEQINSPDAKNYDLKDVYMVVHNTEDEIVDIYKLDPVKGTVEQVEDDFKLEGFY